MNATNPKLLLIDGHSLAFRAFYALPPENFTTTTGQHTNAVYGFVSMLINMLGNEAPTHLAVAFDLSKPTIRLADYPEYKAGRAKTPPEFAGQIDLLREVLGALNIPVVHVEGYEADDVIATLSTQAAAAGIEGLVMSGDRDCLQLVNETTTLLYPKRGVSELTRYTPDAVEEKYAVRPEQYPELAALTGEKADNLPGVPGVGEKTAAKWIAQYGGLDGILEHAEDIKGKAGENLRANVELVRRNRRINRLLTDMDLPIGVGDTLRREPDRAAVGELFDALEFRALGERLSTLIGGEEAAADAGAGVEARVLDSRALRAWLGELKKDTLVAIQTDGSYALGSGDLACVALASSPEEAVAVELADLDPDAEKALADYLGSGSPKVMHSAKTQLKAMAQRGLSLGGLVADTELEAYLLAPAQRSYQLADLATRHLGLSLEAETPDESQLALDLDSQATESLAVSAAAVLGLHGTLYPQLESEGTAKVLEEIELPMIDILADMELDGIAVDTELLKELAAGYRERAEASAEAAYKSIDERVNLGSPKQLQTVLFEKLGMPKTKRTKTGYTTDAEALAELYAKTENPFLEHLLAYRDQTKLAQIVEGLGKSVADGGRIHTTYVQTTAATGRLSSMDPNLQNIPVRSESGRRIRELFVCGGASVTRSGASVDFDDLLTADYSQIEMRIMAHLSADEGLTKAFREGEDLHNFVGSRVFGVEIDQVTGEMRSRIKAMSYGLVYGLSAYGLSRQLGIDVDEARALMTGYFERFGGVKRYLDEIVEQARQAGYTETIDGRRRYLPDLLSDNRQRREMAERAALNAPIQGSAADLMKRAMIGVHAGLASEGLESRMLLQVHDEIIVEVAAGEHEAVAEVVRREMAGAADLTVPLEVNVGTGRSWHAAAH